jgi:hypothetical protein
MPTFIDESGCTGAVALGGKPYFRLAAVHVPTHEKVEAFRAGVVELRSELGLRADYEFKFHLTEPHPDRRLAFYRLAATFRFPFVVCSIDKRAGRWTSVDGRELHWACATSLAACLWPVYVEAEATRSASCGKKRALREPLVVDDNGDGRFLDTIKTAFRGLPSQAKAKASIVGDVSFRESAPDPLLSLPDMTIGAFGAALDGDRQWYKMISEMCCGSMVLP